MRSIDEYSDTSECYIQAAPISLTTSEGLPIFLGNVTNCVNSVRGEEVEKISFEIRETQSYLLTQRLIRLGSVKLVPVCDNFNVAKNLIPFR